MDKQKQIEMIIGKMRQHFLAEMKGKLDRALYDLMGSCLEKNESDYIELKRFFHTVAGTAGTLQLTALSKTAAYCEKYMDNKSWESMNAKDYYSLMTGIGKINDELKVLVLEYLKMPDANISESIQEGEYTTVSDTASILIVDDDITLLNILERVFQMEGYQVAISSKPQEVTQILAKRNFDLIILDIMMPEIDGFEVFRCVRSEFPEIPVIFLTAKTLKEDRLKALKSGVDDYVMKPFETDELLARVESAIMKMARSKKYIITDMLTGVYTKKFFSDDFKEFRARFSRKNEVFSVAFIDIDRFKEVNDTYGHIVGDKVLKDFVLYLKDCFRITDHIFRFGGDEFLVLLPDTETKMAYAVIERIRKELKNKKFLYEGMKDSISLSFSSGIADYKDTVESAEHLLERADKALYMSKNAGRGRTSIFQDINLSEKSDRKKVLIIDDNDIIVRLIATRLNSLGYDVEHTDEGEKGLEMMSAFRPDVLMTDLMLPDIEGFEMCRRASEMSKSMGSKIVVLSSLKDKSSIDRCFEFGIDEYVEKPFSIAEIETIVRRMLLNN